MPPLADRHCIPPGPLGCIGADIGDVVAIKQIEHIGDKVQPEPFAERNAPGDTHIPLEEARTNKSVTSQVSCAAHRGGE